jgi:hypothetical protein
VAVDTVFGIGVNVDAKFEDRIIDVPVAVNFAEVAAPGAEIEYALRIYYLYPHVMLSPVFG